MLEAKLPPAGARVRITQQIPHGSGVWTQSTEGVLVRARQAKTGSWFAHSHGDRLWLDRAEVRLDDGELTVLSLDQFSVIEVADRAAR